MSIDKIQTAFFPSKEITDPDFFVGRKEEVKNSILALSEGGSFIAVHGLRGVGKSSISQQIKLIAMGNERLPKMLKIERYLPKKGFNYLTHYVSCDNYTKNVGDLIKRILFGDNNNPSLFSLTKTGDRKLDQIKETFKAGGSAGLMGFKVEAGGSDEAVYSTHLSDDLIQQFKTVLGTIQKDNQSKSGLLIIVDEFDVLANKEGFGSIVKTCSNEFIKFAVSGIANTITELIVDHTSIGRQLHAIEIEKMPAEEMYGIISRAEHKVDHEITFSEPAKHAIINQAEGFPYFVHLLGKQALLEAFEIGQSTVDNETIQNLNDKVCKGRLKTIYEDIYHSAVKSSEQRELLLKLFAEEDSDEIFSGPIYISAKDLGLTNPSQLMKELTQPQDGSLGILTKVRDQYYRFTDPVAKVYTRIRNWKFE